MFLLFFKVKDVVQDNVVQNQPYDETVEVSDQEEIPSNNATPRINDEGLFSVIS